MGAIKGPIFGGQLQDIFLKVSFTCFKHVDYRVETHCKEDVNLWELRVPAWGENVARRSRIFWILEQFSRAGKKKVKYLCSKVLNVVSFIQAKDFAESRQINLIFKLNVYIRYYTLSRMKNHCYLFCRCSDIKKIEKNSVSCNNWIFSFSSPKASHDIHRCIFALPIFVPVFFWPSVLQVSYNFFSCLIVDEQSVLTNAYT